MSAHAADALFERLERDESFAAELRQVGSDAEASLALVRAEGFDVNQDEVRKAFARRYAHRFTVEQLERVSAGSDGGWCYDWWMVTDVCEFNPNEHYGDDGLIDNRLLKDHLSKYGGS